MKKILLLIILLTIVKSILFSDEIVTENIMPQKLINTVLPDDYPKELDKLFAFYSIILEEIYNIPKTEYYRERADKLSEILKTIPRTQLDNYAYLIWKARTSIPEYFCEYETINSPAKSLIVFGKRNSQSFISEKMHNIMIQHKEFIPGVISLNISIMASFSKEHLEMLILGGHSNWIRCKILESKYILRHKENGKTNPKNYVKVQILDDLSKNFKKKQIIIQLYLNPLDNENKILKKGKEYLIPIEYRSHKKTYVELEDEEDNHLISDIFYYYSGVRLCLEISDKNTICRVNKSPLYENNIFTSDVISYVSAKKVIQETMNLLQRFSYIEK